MTPQERDAYLERLASDNGLSALLASAREDGVEVAAIVWPRRCEGHALATRMQRYGVPVVDGMGDSPALITAAGARRIRREVEVTA